ncbi:MAG: FAD synthase [Euryarchaeota archaeon]|nr:FAD synthase [Euryarchaeota archaeon]
MRVVMAGGVFDILHPGHVFFLERARREGDVLAVVVARDSTVTKRKRIPVVPEEQRVEMVAALKPVDVALLGEEDDIFATVERIEPDVIVLGPDQSHREEELVAELRRRGLECRVLRVEEFRECRLPSTRSILQRIIELNFPDRRLEKR